MEQPSPHCDVCAQRPTRNARNLQRPAKMVPAMIRRHRASPPLRSNRGGLQNFRNAPMSTLRLEFSWPAWLREAIRVNSRVSSRFAVKSW
jgi:hypothetical protein